MNTFKFFPVSVLILVLLAGLACSQEPTESEVTQSQPVQDTRSPLHGFTAPPTDLPLENLVLPDGFSVSLAAQKIPGARSMIIGDQGTLFVGSRGEGTVYALRDLDQDGYYETTKELATGLTMPNGVAFRQGSLYVAEVHRILRFDQVEQNLDQVIEPVVLWDDLPKERHHGWKYIAFGPDDKLYVPVGAPCNICEPGDPYASIMRINADGSQPEIVVGGVRNSVGLAWHPITGELWFTDNGRDMMGDDLPPDELNRVAQEGDHFGYPYCHGQDILDPTFGENKTCDNYQPPVQDLNAHVAALGLSFYTGDMFPETYRNQIFIPEHGSWNRTKKSGYQLSLVRLEGNVAISYEPFVTGWLGPNGMVWGRPVATLVDQDGSLLVSDDFGDAIYRIRYHGGS